jgi:N-acetylglucosamine-6-sulfatase
VPGSPAVSLSFVGAAMDRAGRVSRLTLLTGAAVLAVVLGTLGPGGGVGFGTPLVSTQPGTVAHAVAETGLDLPDIVVILTDDQRVETLAGMPQVQSLLVHQGTTFSRAMVPTSLCCPSRASMLTGSYAHDTGVWTNVRPDGGWWAFQAGGNEARTVAVALQTQGYRTALIGKYFNTFGLYAPPGYRPPGWDEFLAFTTMDRSGDYYDYTLSDGSVHGSKPRDYSTDVLAAAATEVIRTTPATQPLFLWYAPYAPHGPFKPAPRHRHALVELEAKPGDEDVSTKPHWVRALDPPKDEKVARAARRQQQALMAVDEAVAGIVGALADTGRLSDTLIVFASDNGLLWGEHGMLDKNVPYTPATAVPLVLRWDGHVGAGQVDDRMALNIDVTATLAAAGMTGMHTDGSDLLTPARRDGFVLEAAADPQQQRPPYCGWREADWTFVHYSTGEEELYSLTDDPGEVHNLATVPKARDQLDAMRERARAACMPEPPGFDW